MLENCSDRQAASLPTAYGDLLAAAETYLHQGWSLIPLFGKRPALPSWKLYQTHLPTTRELRRWFGGDRRVTGVGLVTGKLSGLVVVDCDSAEDATFWREHFPATPLVASTGGGGTHYYYAASTGAEARNRTKLLGRKIDLRGEGGYAAAPPSFHASGRRYEWLLHESSAKLPAFDAAWLAPSSTASPSRRVVAEVRSAVAYIRRIQATAGEGGHNATFRAACKLRDAGLSEREALAALRDWNETNASPPWSAAELAHKIRSAFALRR